MQRRLPAGGAGDRVAGQGQSRARGASRGTAARSAWVNVCDADLVALGEDPAGQVGVLVDLRADHEERGVGAVRGQHVEDPRGPRRVGAVVEGQRDRAGRHAARGDRAVGARSAAPGLRRSTASGARPAWPGRPARPAALGADVRVT